MSFRNEADRWTKEGRNILSAERMALIRVALEEGPIILEHWFYRRGCSPALLIFEEFEAIEVYLMTKAQPGDAFHIWRYAELCRDDNTLTNGKYPDIDGMVPEGGAY